MKKQSFEDRINVVRTLLGEVERNLDALEADARNDDMVADLLEAVNKALPQSKKMTAQQLIRIWRETTDAAIARLAACEALEARRQNPYKCWQEWCRRCAPCRGQSA